MERKWFEKLLVKSITFALFLFILFFVIKLCFVLYSGVYYDAIGEVKSFGEYINAFINGMRYDSRHIAVLSIVYFLIGLLFFWSELRCVVLWIYAFIVVLVSLFIGIAEIAFYEIYSDVFNANLLGLIFDDQQAIFHTGISGHYGITTFLFMYGITTFLFMYAYSKIFTKIRREYGYDPLSSIRSRSTSKESLITSAILFVIFALLMMFSINSALSFKGVSLDQVIKPVENTFLRKASPGAFRDLYLVYRGYMRISNSHFSDYASQTPLEVVEEYFELDSKQTHYNLKDLLAKKVTYSGGEKINYIFYIVAESLSEWHFDKEFDEINLTSGLKSLLNDAHGVKIGVFLQNAGSTIKSIDVQLTGLFQTEIPINSIIGTLQPFITAPGVIMKDLGYKTNFYYGGSGIWQRLDQYSASQGFEKIYYSTHIIENAKLNGYASPYEGLWGAYDHYLFTLIKDNVFKYRNTPSFNMILTTSNHPPYDVPLEQFNVPLEDIQRFLANHSEYKRKDERFFGHIWYQDKMITRFIQEVSRVLPDSLFVITGDHYDREYPHTQPSLKTTNTIPLILYSPTLEMKKNTNIGSHIDITPSIVELVAPADYTYHSFGSPLVSNDNAALSGDNSALGYFSIATDRFIYNKENEQIEYFHKAMERYNDKELAQSLYKRLQQATALSWWILKNGYEVRNDEAH
ncbi:sulfatase-like hydrolase/transferase [Helicobacter sp. MIT 21-1697]|uniref:LTA synthase family protein n=1 Tax=Helicobacter sp. MIT 21-1697 TaxID=2993733 RepID=UPI00224B2181|nr:alkaline phosphatase family protein [Helicobacter sp. MIT 21-1697]MCX2716774.1 sulfatase-like hydrolase/transferase [Helicobacter sp. MIT 21-1697]